jgi:hypothetical protein
MSRLLHPLIRILCWLTAGGLFAVACGGSGQGFTALNPKSPVAELPEGLSISANPAELPSDFRVQLTALPAATFTSGKAGEAWAAALQALPGNLRLQSALFSIQTQGHLPGQLYVALVLPAGGDPNGFDLYAWNGKSWDFLPAEARGGQLVASLAQPPAVVGLFEAAPVPPLALALLEPGQSLTPAVAGAVNAVLLDGVLLQSDGGLGGQVPGVALHQGYGAYPVLSDQAGALGAVLANSAARLKHLQTLVAFAVSGGYDGIVLDYAAVTPELGPSYAQFVADLAAQLHGQGKELFVQVPSPSRSNDAFKTGGYDWRALGGSADALLVPVAEDPTAFGSGLADALLAWAVGEVPRAHLRLLTSAKSVENAGSQFTLVDQAAALAPLGSVTLGDTVAALHPGEPISVELTGNVQSLAYDPAAFAARYTVADSNGVTRTLWLTTASTLRQRFNLAQKYRLGGVAVTDLMASGAPADMVNAVTQYKAAVQADVQAHAELLWTVRGSQGILALATAQPNRPYVYVAPSAGQYQFSANLQPGVLGPLGSVSVQVAEVTATPTSTDTPTATPTQAPHVSHGVGGNPTQAPGGGATQAPTSPPQPTSSGGGGGFVPPPPIGAGTFELGGQVPGGIGHAAQMQQAGMKWVKFQATGDASGLIAAGHAAGFKVLLSALGDHGRATDPSYWPEYASWVAGMAGAGADAIEIWNEMNIDREWPTGQINGATYTSLLQQAYQAIKAANPGTIVISGALAPTGAEGAFPGSVVNDDHYLQEMANAGAANYMDCVGVHFNDGTTPPDATSGSALSGYHYSYYYLPMVDLYYGAFAGTRPLCFTELGYLTSEGYPSLPAAFAWASGNSLADQAQWLADTASLAGNSGQVRLMIVFNVDFTLYGADPQGGYAIVRPDGSCPACAALGSVVH